MPYVIDGNNLLAQIPGQSMNGAADRRRLASVLSAFCRTRGCKATLYFDGAPLEGWRERLTLGGVSVVHSGAGVTADDAILERVRGAAARADLTVVTSDRSLFERARHLGARAMTCRAFRGVLSRGAGRGSAVGEKPERPGPGEVEYYLGLFGETAPEDPIESKRRR